MNERPAVLEVAGVKVRVGYHLAPETREALYADRGFYEERTARMIQARLSPDDVVMELGTGLGVIAAFCAKAIGSDRVFTYEVMPALESHIRANFALNGVSPTLSICLLAEEEGERTVYVPEAYWGRAGGRKAVTVKARPFNDEVARIDPTFLVVDIEGGEYELARHMRPHNVKKLLLEVHPREIGWEKVGAVFDALGAAGFRVDRTISTKRVYYLSRA
jgi:FkbM family methyltransferase